MNERSKMQQLALILGGKKKKRRENVGLLNSPGRVRIEVTSSRFVVRVAQADKHLAL